MNETEQLIEDLKTSLALSNMSQLSRHFGISRTTLYSYINNNAISLRFYKKLKDQNYTHMINNDYIVNHIINA